MSRKQAVIIATAAGGGMKSTMKDMADSLEMWGIRKVYRLGFGVQATKPDEIPGRIRATISKRTARLARRIHKDAGRQGCNARARKWFTLMRMAHKLAGPMEPDYGYWERQGWHGKGRPWRT